MYLCRVFLNPIATWSLGLVDFRRITNSYLISCIFGPTIAFYYVLSIILEAIVL